MEKISKFANFWRARSRLYQNEILQENMRLTAFSSSTRCAYFCTAAISKFSQKIGLKKQQFSWNFSRKIANVAKFARFCQISKISAWESGRFWKMLQNAYFLAKIGADTAENEQHFAEILPTDALWRLAARAARRPAPPAARPARRPRRCSPAGAARPPVRTLAKLVNVLSNFMHTFFWTSLLGILG